MLRRSANFLIFAAFFLPTALHAQGDKRPDEKTVMLEGKYIEALREKILGNYDEAIVLFGEVLQKDHENAAANYEIARIYELKNQLGEAIIRAERAYMSDKKAMQYALYFAQLLEKKAEYRRAADVYSQLTQQHPEEHKLYLQLAYLLVKSGKPDQAIKAYDDLEKRIGKNSEISNRKYQLHLSMNKTKPAEKELLELTRALPNDPDAWLLLARHYKNNKKSDEAQNAYKQLLRLQPNNSEANIELASSLLASGDELAYLRALSAVFDSPEHAAESKNQILLPFVQKSAQQNAEYNKALLQLCEKNALNHPDNYTAQRLYAQLLSEQGTYPAALAAYRQALRINKNQLADWEQALKIASALHSPSLAEIATDALDLFPNNPQGYYYQAQTLQQGKKYAQALELLQQALPMCGERSDLEALINTEIAIIQQTHNPTKAAAAHTKASEQLQKASSNANTYIAALHFAAARLAFCREDYSQTIALAQKTSSSDPAHAASLELIGDAHAKSGKRQEAARFWQQALEKGNANPRLPEKIAAQSWLED